MPAIRAHGPAQVSNVAATKYTVPAGLRFILRHVHIENPSGAAVTFTMSIGADAAATRLFDAISIAATSAVDYYFYIPLAAAEIIQALSGTNNVLVLTLSGDLEAA